MDTNIQTNEMPEIPPSERLNQKKISPLLIAGTGFVIMILIIIIALIIFDQKPPASEELPEKINTDSQKNLPDGTATPVPSNSVFPLTEKENQDILNIDLGDIDNDLEEVEKDINSL